MAKLNPTSIRACRRFLLVLAVFAFGAAATLFVQFQRNGKIAGRVTIPNVQIQHAEGFSYHWRVPSSLRATPWYRASLRVYEDGARLPLRVETPESVSEHGMGRFGTAPFSVGPAQRETLWLSATDNANPITNGRVYEFEVNSLQYRFAILSAFSLALSVILVLAALPITQRAVLTLARMERRRLLRRLAAALGLATAGLFSQAMPGIGLQVRCLIPSARVTCAEAGAFQYRLPRWVGNSALLNDGTLYEDGVALKHLERSEWESSDENGAYVRIAYPPRLIFRPCGDTNPTNNGKLYSFSAPLVAPQAALGLSAALVVVIALLSGYRKLTDLDWKWLLFAVGAAKLYAVAGGEIVTQKYDSVGYANSAIGMVWGTTALPLGPAGFPAIAGLVSQIGVPWRLALEIMYLLACGSLVTVFARIVSSRVVACLLFAAMTWHPWTFSGFAPFMPMPLVLVLQIALLALMFRVFEQSRTVWNWTTFACLSLLVFFWEWCRHEDPLVYASYGLFAVLAWWLTRGTTAPPPLARRIAYLVLPVGLVLALSTGVRALNYAQFGIFAKSAADMPGLMALMKALYRVKPEQQIRYAPVTRQSLEAACGASPTLGQYKDQLLDPLNHQTLFGESFTKRPGEFGPWLNWLLPSSLPGDPQEKNTLMTRAAGEVSDAIRCGRLPSQSAHFPLDPNWRLWLPDLFPCILKVLREGISMKAYNYDLHFPAPEVASIFDMAANRRTSGANPNEVTVDGRVQAQCNSMQGLVLLDHDGYAIAVAPLKQGTEGNESVFRMPIIRAGEKETIRIAALQENRLAISDGEPVAIGTNGKATLSNDSHPILLPKTGQAMEYSANLEYHVSPKAHRIRACEEMAEWICKGLTALLLLVTFGVVFFKPAWDSGRLRLVFACWVLATGWLLGRAALYGLLAANVGWSTDRYMRPIAPLFILILTLGTALAAAVLQRGIRRIRAMTGESY